MGTRRSRSSRDAVSVKARDVDDTSIPDFLLAKNRKQQAREELKTLKIEETVDAWRAALDAVKPDEFREFIDENIRRGRFERRWLVPDDSRYYFQADVDATTKHWRSKFEERAERDRLNREAAAKRLAAVPRLPSPTKGMIPLRELLAEMGEDAPRRGHARAAVDAARLEHVKYHFPRSVVTLAHVRQTILSYVPPASAGRGVKSVFNETQTISFEGKNPKKEGTGAHERWKKLIGHSGHEVGVFLRDGGNPTTLQNAIKSGRAKLVGGETVPEKKVKLVKKKKEAKKSCRSTKKEAGRTGRKSRAK